jgi:hypothetical protein
MADDWEDWENDEFQPVVAVKAIPGKAALPAAVAEVDASKFQGEDAELDVVEDKHPVQKPQVSRRRSRLLEPAGG